MFNLDEIIHHFGNINRKYYLGELLRNASTDKLHKFKKEVKAHQSKSIFIQDIMPGMSVHDTIVAAINFELLKRSSWYRIYKALITIRKKLVSWFSGVDLKEHPYCGLLYTPRQNRKTIFHITMTELVLVLKRFWLLHFKFIIGTLIAIGMLIVSILKYIAVTKQMP